MNFSIEDILKLDKKYRVAILIGSLLLLVCIYVFLFYQKAGKDIKMLELQLDKLLTTKAEQEAIIQNLDQFKKENQRLKQTLQTAMAQLPDKKEIHSLLQNISNLGRESGLTVPLFKPGKEKKKDFYAEVPVDIRLAGMYRDILTFFHRVGELSRIVNISNLSIQREKKEESKGVLNASCIATTYRFLEESERPPPEEKGKKKKRKKRRH